MFNHSIADQKQINVRGMRLEKVLYDALNSLLKTFFGQIQRPVI